MKTMAIRLEDEQHARLTILSKLAGTTVTDTIRDAIAAHLTTLASDGEISAKAADLTKAIVREAAAQQEAIRAMFEPVDPPKPTPRTRTVKS